MSEGSYLISPFLLEVESEEEIVFYRQEKYFYRGQWSMHPFCVFNTGTKKLWKALTLRFKGFEDCYDYPGPESWTIRFNCRNIDMSRININLGNYGDINYSQCIQHMMLKIIQYSF